MKKAFFRIATCVAIGLCGMMSTASATPFSLVNGPGFADGDTGGLGGPIGTGGPRLLTAFGGPVGTSGYQDHLFEEDFYIGDATGAVYKLTSLPLLGEVITPTSVSATYGGPGYEVDLRLELTAPNMLSERLFIRAVDDVQQLRIWEYTDYDVVGPLGGDTASLLAPGHIRQTDGPIYAEVIVHGPTPDHWEIGGFPGLRDAIQAGMDLTDTNGGTPGADNSFAFEWIIPSLAPGEVFTIDKWKKTGEVPEPGTFGLMALAGFALAAVRMRKRLG